MRVRIDLNDPAYVIKFPSGEEQFRITDFKQEDGPDDVNLLYRSMCPDIMRIAMAYDAVKRDYCLRDYPISLSLPYCPYARQDRVAECGDSLAIKVFADQLNSIGFDQVIIADPHSDVTPALINNCHVIPAETLANFCMMSVPGLPDKMQILAPDIGASKKARSIAKRSDRFSGFIQADKIRDPADGSLSGFTVLSGDTLQENVMICDDICDRGGTFIGLASVIRDWRRTKWIGLYVTHGLFTKGVDLLLDHFDCVITTDSVRNAETRCNFHCIEMGW